MGSCCATWCTIMCQMSDRKPLFIACLCLTVWWFSIEDVCIINYQTAKLNFQHMKHLRPSEVKYHIKVTSSYWVHRYNPVFMETVPGAAHVGKAVTHSEWNRSREVMSCLWMRHRNECGSWRGVDFPTQKPANTC